VTLKLHNTLSGQVEEFSPLEANKTNMFVCGPTVYDYAHIGNAKTYTQFDIVARSLRYLGFDVNYLQNITDIDDKIIARAAERGIDPATLALEYEERYLEDMKSMNNVSVTKYARAHDYIEAIVSQVERLVEKGFAYKISDGYYFDITSFADYGKLSGRSALKADDSVSRIDENPEKKNQGDFCLWKFKKEGDPSWDVRIGEGRPGWHIEDTAITETEFGPQYDLHGGAVDLIFPHHEAEIAQMEALSGQKPFVKYWLHTGFLQVNGEKMSKSKNNFYTIRDVAEKGFSPLALRYLFLLSHYRTPVNFTWEALEAANNAFEKLKRFVGPMSERGAVDESYKAQFTDKLENDLNTPQALAVLWTLVKDKDISPENKLATLLDFDRVLGLGLK
jgi:cysteinyl-tRNA synthetase